MELVSKGRKMELDLKIDPEKVLIAKPHETPSSVEWEKVTEEGLDNPMAIEKLEDTDLNGKKVCIIVDDWGRPTPAYRIVPSIVKRLEAAGVRDEDIVFVTASGMHDPMSESDLRRKLGNDIYNRFKCVAHDAGDAARLAFMGFTDLGTPVWVNKYVAEADFKIAVGRVYPHIAYGYEGGYKMIVPGVASFETITRDHSLNYSSYSVYGNIRMNPSRLEADAVGRLVGIDFLLNFVMGFDSNPVKSYSGKVEEVFEACVSYGERKVWGTKVGKKYDITIIAAGDEADKGIEDNPTYFLGLALDVTKESGTIIAVMNEKVSSSRNIIEGIDLEELSLSDLLHLHEKRTWNCSERQVQHYIKSIRGVFYNRRIMQYHKQKLFIVSDSYSKNKLDKYNACHFTDINEAYRQALALYEAPDVLVIPEGKKTFPMVDYSL